MALRRFEHAAPPQLREYGGNLEAWAAALTDYVSDMSRRLEESQGQQASRNVYVISNDTATLTLDAGAATLAQLRNLVATLLRDLAQKSIIRTKGSA